MIKKKLVENNEKNESSNKKKYDGQREKENRLY